MRIDIPTEDIEHLIASLGFDNAKNLIQGRALSKVMVDVEAEMSRYAELGETRHKKLFVGSPASANNQPQPPEPPQPVEPELNFFAPKKILQVMLSNIWYEKVCTCNHVFNKEWTDQLLEDLLASEYAEYLARKWSKKNQRNMIKGHVIGLLADNGVIKGSNLSIARAFLGVDDNSKDKDKRREVTTFAKYLGNGKDEPYADWMGEYIKNTPKMA